MAEAYTKQTQICNRQSVTYAPHKAHKSACNGAEMRLQLNQRSAHRAATRGTQMQAATNILDLLMTAPAASAPAVQAAMRHVCQGEWKEAWKAMDAACELCAVEDDWFNEASAVADRLHKKYHA